MNIWTNIIVTLSTGLSVLFFSAGNTELVNRIPTEEGVNKTYISSTTTNYVLDALPPLKNSQPVSPNSQKKLMDQSSNLKKTSPLTTEYRTSEALAGLELMAWIYPYQPACAAQNEYSDGRKIDILKPEFFTINGGSLILLDESVVSCNGYSQAFVADLKRHSTSQFVTISSASGEDMASFLHQALLADTDIKTLVNFVVVNNLTGIELNFEDFGSWTEEDYADFKTFVSRLGTALHSKGKQLMVIGPPVANEIEELWYVWRYEDFTLLPVDRMVVMGYDYQFDHSTSEPVAPLNWLRNVVTWVSARYPKDRLTIALPSYGYEGLSGTQKISLRTYEQIKLKPNYQTATRDPRSAEMTWQDGDKVYFYQDSVSLAKKRDLVTSLGIKSISIWHLGGNLWFK